MHVTLIAVQSLDGFITRHDTPGTAFASEADQAHFFALLKGFDASIMGGETYRVTREFILSRMTAIRRRVVMTRDPSRFASDAIADRLEFTAMSPQAIIESLRARGHRRCALLGGSQIHSLFLDAGYVDELIITVEPRLFGAGTGFLSRRSDVNLLLQSHERLEGTDTLALRYRVKAG